MASSTNSYHYFRWIWYDWLREFATVQCTLSSEEIRSQLTQSDIYEGTFLRKKLTAKTR